MAESENTSNHSWQWRSVDLSLKSAVNRAGKYKSISSFKQRYGEFM
jgi:hypothetical protein